MSLLTRPRHTVEVQLRSNVRTARGQMEYEDYGPRIPLRGAMQPVREWSTAEEIRIDGLQYLNLMRWFSRDFPGDAFSHIYFEGYRYEIVGEPQHNSMGRRTSHWALTLRRIGHDPKFPTIKMFWPILLEWLVA